MFAFGTNVVLRATADKVRRPELMIAMYKEKNRQTLDVDSEDRGPDNKPGKPEKFSILKNYRKYFKHYKYF